MIDVLPPGLYEAVFEAKTDDTVSPDLVAGNWVDALRGPDPGRYPCARRQRYRR